MREAVALTLASVRRGSGLAGLAAAVAGVSAALSAVAPWYEAVAELAMMGATQERAVVVLRGAATAPGLVAAAAGAGVAVLGASLAVDRHPGWTRTGLLSGAGLVAAAGVAAQLWRPALARFPDPLGALADLRAVAGDLPTGVELSLTVRSGSGATVAIVASLVAVAAVAAARDLDER